MSLVIEISKEMVHKDYTDTKPNNYKITINGEGSEETIKIKFIKNYYNDRKVIKEKTND